MLVRWRAAADPDTGVGVFRIYRDGVLVGERRVWAVSGGRPGDTFVSWNNSDQPDEPLVAMRFSFRGASEPDALWSVTTVNRAGGESALGVAVPN